MRKKAFFNIGLAIIVMSVIFFSQSCTRTEDDMDDPPRQDVGDTLWIQDIQRDSFFILGASLALSPDQKTFYYAEGGGNVYWTGTRIVARDVASGSVKWRSDAVDHFAISSQIVVGDQGNIYVTGFYSLFAFDANNGSTLWSWTVPNELPDPQNPQVNVFTRGQIGALALTNDDNLVMGSIGPGSYNRSIFGISSSGEMLWYNLEANGTGVIGPIVIGNNDVAYYYSNIGGPPEDLIAVESGSGNMLWSLQVENVRSGGNNIVINDEGNLLCAFKKTGDSDRRLHIIDAESSEIIWTSSATAESGNKWVGMDGTVYQWFQFEGGMNAFTMPSGDRQVFSTEFGAQHLGAINDENQLVAINGNITPSKLTVYNSDGSRDWDVSINGMANFPMLITDNGIIIGIINDHPVSFIPKKLVAIQGNAKLAVDGWPRISHDNRNTSNWNK